ncbi:hypothetical protein E6O75_ATG00472 [Venturia nashicola]|uniref:DUF4350 domain-containing protein n=1 Tax=Venturia nashicola TaxID=86259 RepID=A0A4Z1PDW8_9PEZI|nr:hypothetical protein E6O75_ATG00472 [Venturia nashicola]
MAAAKPLPIVFALRLDDGQLWERLFDKMYADQIDSLSSKYRIVRARKPDAAKRWLANPENKPIAILITDPGAVSNVAILDLVKGYVQAGGIAVFMANFSSFINLDDMDKLWKHHWGLDWKVGAYHRTEVHLNRATPSLSPNSLEPSYSQKAVFLEGVAPENALYLPSPQSRTQSLVFSPEPVKQDQTPAAFIKRGDGWLGYLGDVNNEAGTQKVVMEICRFASYIAGDI